MRNEELQREVLAGIISKDLTVEDTQERMPFLLAKLKDEWLDDSYLVLWQVVCKYHALTGTTPLQGDFEELLARRSELPISKRVEYSELFDSVSSIKVDFARLKFSVNVLGERWRHQELTDILQTASRINAGSLSGDEIGKALSGYRDAVSFVSKELTLLQQEEEDSFAEGNINDEYGDLLKEYEDAKSGTVTGIFTGFQLFDQITNGLHPGELMLVTGYTGEFKSTLAYNIAYSACYNQGKNVLFGSAEVSRSEVRRHIVARHSRNPKFNLDSGLSYTAIRNGTLSAEEELLYQDVLADLSSSEYGLMYIFPIPHKQRVSYIDAKLQQVGRTFPIDLIVIDYLGLLGAAGARKDRREELNDVLIAAKRLATDANNGKGVAVLSPWQVSRSAWDYAGQSGHYTKSSLAETSEAEKSSDVVLSTLRSDPTRSSKLHMQILKNRDGREGDEFDLYCDPETTFISDSNMNRFKLE